MGYFPGDSQPDLRWPSRFDQGMPSLRDNKFKFWSIFKNLFEFPSTRVLSTSTLHKAVNVGKNFSSLLHAGILVQVPGPKKRLILEVSLTYLVSRKQRPNFS